jgi:hypothetical protein
VCGLELECQGSLIYNLYVRILVESSVRGARMSREFDISVRIGARMSREFDIKLICRYTSEE